MGERQEAVERLLHGLQAPLGIPSPRPLPPPSLREADAGDGWGRGLVSPPAMERGGGPAIGIGARVDSGLWPGAPAAHCQRQSRVLLVAPLARRDRAITAVVARCSARNSHPRRIPRGSEPECENRSRETDCSWRTHETATYPRSTSRWVSVGGRPGIFRSRLVHGPWALGNAARVARAWVR